MSRTPEEQIALDHVWVHAAQYAQLAQEDGLKVFERGEGCIIYDVRGRGYLDAFAGLCVVNVGHGRREIAEAMAEQAARLGYVSSFTQVSLPAARLAAKLASLTPPGLERVFFCAGGSEAVESAVKIARQYHVLNGDPHRNKIISRRESYHGATWATLSLGSRGRPFLNKFFGPLMANTPHAEQVYCYRCPLHLTYPECRVACVDTIEDVIRFEGPDTVAAVVAEPISMTSRIAIPPNEYWPRLREICDRHGVLLIADEVITGFGRTGRMFGLEHWGVAPDLMTIGKGFTSGYAPMAAVICQLKVAEAFAGDASKTLRHGFTFGGQAVAAAAALKAIEIIEREDLAGNSARMGARLLEGLRWLAGRHPVMGDVQGLGLLAAVELEKDRRSRQKITLDEARLLEKHLLDLGVITRVWDTLFFAPPLCISAEEVDRLVDLTGQALTRFEADLGLG
jgi:adenosylmethionine-8-amino-7-oxononanoate aminotransferase